MPLLARARASTIGRAGVCISASSSRVSSQSSRAAAISRTMTREACRNDVCAGAGAMTADSLVASTAR